MVTTAMFKKFYSVSLLLLTFLGFIASHAYADQLQQTEQQKIDKLMDGFHAAAAAGDKTLYLAHFSKNSVFMGTDDWERWPSAEFSEYVDTRFKDGKGWSYKSLERHINFSESGETAWFDEITYSEKWGRFRGTGVLLKEGDAWKVAHYSMSVLVPNEAWEQTTKLIKEAFSERLKQKGLSEKSGN